MRALPGWLRRLRLALAIACGAKGEYRPLARINRDIALKGAEAIGEFPEPQLQAALELLSAADGPLWRLYWPGVQQVIWRAHDAKQEASRAFLESSLKEIVRTP